MSTYVFNFPANSKRPFNVIFSFLLKLLGICGISLHMIHAVNSPGWGEYPYDAAWPCFHVGSPSRPTIWFRLCRLGLPTRIVWPCQGQPSRHLAARVRRGCRWLRRNALQMNVQVEKWCVLWDPISLIVAMPPQRQLEVERTRRVFYSLESCRIKTRV